MKKQNDESRPVELEIEGFSSEGEGVGRHDHMAVFVPFCIPGERIKAQIREQKKRYCRATLTQVLSPSPDRVTPPCPVFGLCGGCQLQHITYHRQLALKRQRVHDALQRIGATADTVVAPVFGMEDPWRYRNKIVFHCDNHGRVGLFKQNTHDIIPVTECLLVSPAMNRAAQDAVSQLARNKKVAGELTVRQSLTTEKILLSIPDSPPFSGTTVLEEQLAGTKFQISAHSFFQINTRQAARLYSVAVEMAEPTRNDRVLDAFCGVGGFSLFFAPHVNQVVGVEGDTRALADAQTNAVINNSNNVKFMTANLIHPSKAIKKLMNWATLLIVDPPRQGLSRELIASIGTSPLKKLIYTSCDPATLSRDIRLLQETGFHLVSVIPVDMFPQTAHIECVSLLQKS